MDNLFSRILVGIDDSEPASFAVTYAARLARDHGGGLVLASVVNWLPLVAQAASSGAYIDVSAIIDALREEAQAVLDRGSEIARRFGVAAERRMPEGDPRDMLVALAREENAGVIVTGTHGRRGAGRMFLGSTAEMVLRSSTIPVITVRNAVAPEREAQRCISRILIGVDNSEPSDAALDTVLALPPEDCREVLIYGAVDVYTPVGVARTAAIEEQHFAETEAIVERAVKAAHERNVHARGFTLEGRPEDVIVGAAAAAGVDLIVVGSHGRRGLRRFFLGSVAEHVVRSAAAPTLVVRTARPQ
ncbi:MAG: universal stress protein [Candidatus Lustribacter sp.]|jgi:nucleotide-binding universal stress UspA family protein